MSLGVRTGKKDNSKRKYPEKGGSHHNPVNIDAKRAEALERQVAYDALTIAQKVELLDRRFGKNVGAKKQRARLELAKTNKRSVSTAAQEPAQQQKAKDRRASEQAERPGHAD